MSGGKFDYKNDSLSNELFGWDVSTHYGIGESKLYTEFVAQARRINPMRDRLLSELVYDVFCLLNSLDYWLSGDTSESQYRADVKQFKKKWLKSPSEELVTREIEHTTAELQNTLDTLKADLYRDLLWTRGDDDRDTIKEYLDEDVGMEMT